MGKIFSAAKAQLAKGAAQLHALSPLGVMARGYAIATGEDGAAVVSSRQIKEGEQVFLRFARGAARCKVIETIEEDKAGRHTEQAARRDEDGTEETQF